MIVYPGAVPLETDLLNTNRNVLTGIGALIQDLLGTSTVFTGLTVVPTIPATMSVTVNPGNVYSLQNIDNTAYSSLAANEAQQIMKQGLLATSQTLAMTAPVTSGQSVNYLISAAFVEQDIGPTVLPYYNAANPQVAWSGPGGLGGLNNTTRQDTVALTLTPGVPAVTGTQTTPATPTGTTPLYVVTVANGATTIVAANIVSQNAPTPIFNIKAGQTGVTAPLGTNTTQLATMAALYAGLYQGKGVMPFTSSGSFVVPAGVTASYLSGCPGGGGGGGCATVGSPNVMSGAGGGGAGQPAIRKKVTVVPGETLTITIGAGGIAGAINTVGGTGGITSIVGSISGTLLTLTGGLGGLPGLAGTFSSYQAGQSGGVGFPNGAYGQDTGPVGIGAIGGNGASGPFGGGGPGGRGSLVGTAMFAGSPGAGNGSGGGGCGGVYPGGNTTIPTCPGSTGGAGSAGLAIIEW